MFRVIRSPQGHWHVLAEQHHLPPGWEVVEYCETRAEACQHIAGQGHPLLTTPPLSSGLDFPSLLLLANHDPHSYRVNLQHLHYSALLEHTTELVPDKPCISGEGSTLTFAEVQEQVGRISGHLRRWGVRKGSHVVLVGERNTEYFLCLLAILRAGAVYIPVDPDLPANRIQAIMQSLHDPWAIDLTGDLHHLSRLNCTRLVFSDLTSSQAGLVTQPEALQGYDLAYIIFTSGSTGSPKGVKIHHGGMINHIVAKTLDLELTQKDTLAQTASQSFDISIWQFLTGPLLGAHTVIYSTPLVHHPLRLLDHIRRDRITVLESVPTLIRTTIQYLRKLTQPLALNDLRCLMLTGEPLSRLLCEQWFELYPHIPIINAYGPTECSDDVTHHHVSLHTLGQEGEQIPLGHVLTGLNLHVCDEHLQPLLPGSTGVLYVSGAGVGYGYLNNLEKTLEHFLPNPFNTGEDYVLYHTGDQVQLHLDRRLTFIQRVDQQVKFRGYRIELTEVEDTVAHVPGVVAAAALVAELQGRQHLVCFFTHDHDTPPAEDAIKHHCQQHLPDYMVPTLCIALPTMPTLYNGKLDRNALMQQASQLVTQ